MRCRAAEDGSRFVRHALDRVATVVTLAQFVRNHPDDRGRYVMRVTEKIDLRICSSSDVGMRPRPGRSRGRQASPRCRSSCRDEPVRASPGPPAPPSSPSKVTTERASAALDRASPPTNLHARCVRPLGIAWRQSKPPKATYPRRDVAKATRTRALLSFGNGHGYCSGWIAIGQ